MDHRVITVTLSPWLQRTLVTHYLATGYKNRTEKPDRLDPAGAGVSIARALRQFECGTHAVILLGADATGLAYRALVQEQGFEVTLIIVDGPTRSETTILDSGTGEETHLVGKGAPLHEADLSRVVEALKSVVREGDVVVLAGPLPEKAAEDTYARLLERVRDLGAEGVVATGGPALAPSIAARPSLVATRQLECEAFFNFPIRVLDDVVAAGRRLIARGAEQALIGLREGGGAVLIAQDTAWKVDLPEVEDGTASGVWEAVLAGFLAGRCRQERLERALETGGAAAAYVAGEVGEEFGSPAEIERLRPEIELTSLDEEEDRAGGGQ
jgi:1-phosphofructokinase